MYYSINRPISNSLSFKAGLTTRLITEIQKTDPNQISRDFANKNIEADFKNNKIVAWCCARVAGVLEAINDKYRQEFTLPKAIFVENFNKLKIKNKDLLGFCNLLPAKIRNDEVTSSRTIFFNDSEDWANLDKMSDYRFLCKKAATPHFLDVFMHEFLHVVHEDRLMNKVNSNELARLFVKFDNPNYSKIFKEKYGDRLSKICDYATKSPLEAVSCDMSKTIIGCLDENTFFPQKDPFKGTPYEKLSFFKRIVIPYYKDEERPLKEILRNFWNGDFS